MTPIITFAVALVLTAALLVVFAVEERRGRRFAAGFRTRADHFVQFWAHDLEANALTRARRMLGRLLSHTLSTGRSLTRHTRATFQRHVQAIPREEERPVSNGSSPSPFMRDVIAHKEKLRNNRE